MPIRTHRGRAAVYRTFWGWPLRSPTHLAGAVLLFAAVAAGLALIVPGGGNGASTVASSSTARTNPFDPASRAALPGAEATQTRSSTPAAALADTQTLPTVPAEALVVATAWVRAFLTAPDGISSVRWAEQMRQYTTDEGLSILQSIDPANVPEAQIIGKARPVSAGAGKAEVDVPTTAVVVRLLLVPTSTGWRVASFEQAG